MCPDQVGSFWDPNPSTGETSDWTGVETGGAQEKESGGGAITSSSESGGRAMLPESEQ